MKFRKILSATLALTLSTSILAGLAVTANASATPLKQDFEDVTSTDDSGFSFSYPSSGAATPSIISDESADVTNGNTTTFLSFHGGTGGDSSMTTDSMGITARYTNVSMDFRIDPCNGDKSSNLAILGEKSTSKWINSAKQILTISTGTCSGNGYFASTGPTINGNPMSDDAVVTGVEAAATSLTNSKYQSTGWLHLSATIDLEEQTVTAEVTRISSGETVYSDTIEFVNAGDVTQVDTIYAAVGKNYGGISVDNIVVTTYDPKMTVTVNDSSISFDAPESMKDEDDKEVDYDTVVTDESKLTTVCIQMTDAAVEPDNPLVTFEDEVTKAQASQPSWYYSPSSNNYYFIYQFLDMEDDLNGATVSCDGYTDAPITIE